MGNTQEALTCFDKALKLDPDFEIAKKAKNELLTGNK